MRYLFACLLVLLFSACDRERTGTADRDSGSDPIVGETAVPLVDDEECTTGFTTTLTQTILMCDIEDADPPSSEIDESPPDVVAAGPIDDLGVPTENATEIPVDPPSGCGYSSGPWPVEIVQTRFCNGALGSKMTALLNDKAQTWDWQGLLADKPDDVPSWDEPLVEVGVSCVPCGSEPPPVDNGGSIPVSQ